MSAVFPLAPVRDVARAVSPDNRLFVIAHRGDWRHQPENSLAAIAGAAALGADMVEIDVRRTADDALVVFHDAVLDRMTEHTGPVSALSGAELRSLRLRAGAGGPDAATTGEHMPSLAEALEAARGRIFVNLDTKDPRDLPLVMAAVADLRMINEVLIKADVDPSQDRLPIEDLPLFGAVPFMPVVEARAGRFGADARRLSRFALPMVECHYDAVEALAEGRAARPDLRLWVNTLDCAHSLDFDDTRALADPDAVWGRLVDAGVTAIQTDRTADLIAWAAAWGLR